MALETFNYIDSLVVTNPTATDNVSQGDDHLRGIKTTLKNTFPNVTGAVTPTQAELNFVDGVTSNIQTQINNINTDLVNDTTPQLGGTLDTNSNPIDGLTGVSVQYGGVTKVATTSTGVSVTGEVALSGTGVWTAKDDGTGNLIFYAGGVAKMKLDTSGNLTVTGNVTGYGTI